jgi:hypothetical protein
MGFEISIKLQKVKIVPFGRFFWYNKIYEKNSNFSSDTHYHRNYPNFYSKILGG